MYDNLIGARVRLHPEPYAARELQNQFDGEGTIVQIVPVAQRTGEDGQGHSWGALVRTDDDHLVVVTGVGGTLGLVYGGRIVALPETNSDRPDPADLLGQLKAAEAALKEAERESARFERRIELAQAEGFGG